MSSLILLNFILTGLQIFVLSFIVVRLVAPMIRAKTTFLPFFLFLAMVSYLLSDLYWIVYDTLKPGTRMPIAANEIAECSVILLLSAGLNTMLRDKAVRMGEVLFAALFIGANIALWIVWSGEWLQDIVFGIPYVYFVWVLIRGLRTRGSMTPHEIKSAFVACISFVVLHVVLILVGGFAHLFIESVCFGLMFAVMAWLGLKSYQEKDIFVASTFLLWTNLVMFSSYGYSYQAAYLANTIALLLLPMSMKKEIAADALC